jgi:hypothetical protein
MRISAAVATAFVLVSCSAVHRDLSHLEPSGSAVDAVFAASLERTRLAVSSVLDEENIAVETIDDVLGVIWTEFVAAGVDVDEQACLGLSTGDDEWVEAIRYRLRLEVTREGKTRTRVRAYADVQGKISSQSRDGGRARKGIWHDCTSTGEIERRILDTVQARVEKG